jgi:uncharacterized protein YegJ (DUF2314 family)
VWFGYGVILPAGTDETAALAQVEAALRAEGIAVLAPQAEPLVGAKSASVQVLAPSELGYDAGLLVYKGRGVEADGGRLNAATHAVAVLAFAPLAERASFVRSLAKVALSAASMHDGWVLDGTTREVFAASAFAERRPANVALDVAHLTIVHMVREDGGERVFLQTIGLERLGVPDLLVRNVHSGLAGRVDAVLQAAAQTLLERGAMTRDGELDVDWAALAEPTWREGAAELARAGGTGRITVRANWSDNTIDGEPRVIEVVLAESDEAMARALDRTLGPVPTEVIRASDGDAELEAARARAQTELAALAPRFASGIPVAERLRVKAPFGDPRDGIEWMWVEVDSWRGDVLHGVLTSEPMAIPALRLGTRVEVRQSELFDYVHTRADRSEAGNETTHILMRRQEGR